MPRTPPTEKSRAVGARLRALRKQAGVKQAVVAEAVGIERGTLAGIETGAAFPGRETMAALADYFNVTLDHLDTGAPLPGDQLPAQTVKDITQASLLRFWNLLDEAQQEEIVDRMAEMIGSRLEPSATVKTRHSKSPPGRE